MVTINNLTGFDTNYQFVRHVVAMDTTFAGNPGLWRALAQPSLALVLYWLIILWELATSLLLAWGTLRMARSLQANAAEFARAKDTGIYGLTLGLMLWLLAFITVGGEWFLMWQSRLWNGEETAGRNFLISAVLLVLLAQQDGELRH